MGNAWEMFLMNKFCPNEWGQQFFKDRILFYTTFPIRDQQMIKEWNYRLKAVYVIGILNFTFDEQSDDFYHHEVKLMDTRTKEVFYDKLTFIYLEMPKFNKSEEELNGMFEKWKEGEKIGIEKGAKKKAIEMVQSLKAKGVAISIIAECSGLSEEEINSL